MLLNLSHKNRRTIITELKIQGIFFTNYSEVCEQNDKIACYI